MGKMKAMVDIDYEGAEMRMSSSTYGDKFKEATSKSFAEELSKSRRTVKGERKEKEEKVSAEKRAGYFKKADKAELAANQKMFSAVFGFKPPFGKDFPVTIFSDTDWDESVRVRIPDVIHEYEFQKEPTAAIAYAIESGKFLSAVGPTGSGKSSVMEQVCALLRRPFLRINGRRDMQSSDMFGQYVVKDGETVWKDGLMTLGVKTGAVVCLDEHTAIPAGISMSLQWLREHGGKLLLADNHDDEKIIEPNENFRLFCTDNTRGLGDGAESFAGTLMQNTASLNRFDMTVSVPYLNQASEVRMLKKYFPDMHEDLLTNMVKIAGLIRTAHDQGSLSVTLSARNLIAWGRQAEDFEDHKQSFLFSFYNLLPSDEERTAVKNLFQTVFDEKL